MQSEGKGKGIKGEASNNKTSYLDGDYFSVLETDPSYPRSLFRLPKKPHQIHSSRPLHSISRPAVAIIGSRKADPQARQFAFFLAKELAKRKASILSGGAEGIDSQAHEGALSVDGETWFFAPHGRNSIFPKSNRTLFERIQHSRGGLVWPFQADAKAINVHFLIRNSIMVALSDVVVVIQAARRSGTEHAASWARKLEVPLFVVPGPPWMPLFEGCNLQIVKGGIPLWKIDTLFEQLDLSKGDKPSKSQLFSQLTQDEKEILAHMNRAKKEKMHFDEIVEASRFSVSKISQVMFLLLSKEIVSEEISGFFRIKSEGT